MQVTSESIKSAVARELKKKYPNVNLYKNKVKQGLKYPCFFIAQINTSNTKVSKDKYELDYLLNIRYHDEDPTRVKLDEVGFTLLGILERIDTENLYLFGRNLRYEITDDVLIFYVNYKVRVIKPIEVSKLQELELNGGLK